MRADLAKRTAGLALYATCGDLVVAFGIEDVVRVHLAETVTARLVDPTALLHAANIDDERLPAWDLGALLGLRRPTSARAWIVLTTGAQGGRLFAVSCDRSLTVRPVRVDLPLAATLFTSRAGAVRGAFATASLTEESELAPTGVLLAASALLSPDEQRAAAKASSEGKVTW